jgi:hypothetical protein
VQELRISCAHVALKNPFKNNFSNYLKPSLRRCVQFISWGRKVKMLKSIVCTYPDFRTLPKGLKQMLVVSENIFFNEAQAPAINIIGQEAGSRQLWLVPQRPFFRQAVLVAA